MTETRDRVIWAVMLVLVGEYDDDRNRRTGAHLPDIDHVCCVPGQQARLIMPWCPVDMSVSAYEVRDSNFGDPDFGVFGLSDTVCAHLEKHAAKQANQNTSVNNRPPSNYHK